MSPNNRFSVHIQNHFYINNVDPPNPPLMISSILYHPKIFILINNILITRGDFLDKILLLDQLAFPQSTCIVRVPFFGFPEGFSIWGGQTSRYRSPPYFNFFFFFFYIFLIKKKKKIVSFFSPWSI
jgi:hypothetical protein